MPPLARTLTAASLGLVALAACRTGGTGTGALETAPDERAPPSATVVFRWRSEPLSPTKGTISADVPGLGRFRGKYVQITSETQGYDVNPYLGGGWHPAWNSWDGWGPGAAVGETFITHYSGKVIALLRSDDGESMRCRFRLAEPARGPAGGGMGECELSNGDAILFVELEGR